MEGLEYRKNMNHNYLAAKRPEQADYQLEMLLENEIPGLLRAESRWDEGREEIYYEISSLQPLSRVYEHREIRQEEAKSLLRGVLSAYDSLGEYMLTEDGLVLEADLLYVDPESLSCRLLFLPWRPQPFRTQLLELAEYLMEHAEQGDAEAAMWSYRLYRRLRNENFVLSELRELLEEERPAAETRDEPESRHTEYPEDREEFLSSLYEEEETADTEEMPWWKRFFSGRKKVLSKKEGGKEKNGRTGRNGGQEQEIRAERSSRKPQAGVADRSVKEERDHGKEAESRKERGKKIFRDREDGGFCVDEAEAAENFDISAAFLDLEPLKEQPSKEDYGKTVFIGDADLPAENVLLEKGKGKRYPMERFPFTIGKVKNKVDLPLNDNSVSRIHARILMQNGRAYLQDCHSTNGTFINGIQLEAEEQVLLEKEDEIRIGRVRFSYL